MRSMSRCVIPLFAACAVICTSPASAADHAKGSITLGKHTAAIAHATLVRAPDEMDPSHAILRLYLSPDDIAAKIKACKTLSCADQALGDGASVDYSDASHLGYWVRLNGGLVQNSGGTDAAAFALSTKAADHLAGKLHVDDSQSGGPKIDADFDATVAATFTSAR